MRPESAPLRVHTFSPGWGLPTVGPFGLKLLACLSILGVPYELVHEDDARKGPKRKSPWVIDDDMRLGDTELILRHLEATRGVRLDRDLDPALTAKGHAIRRLLEEHFHQVFEHELVVRDDGFAGRRAIFAQRMPPLQLAIGGPLIRRSMRRHLFERGLGRHSPAEIESLGRADVDALVALLGDRTVLPRRRAYEDRRERLRAPRRHAPQRPARAGGVVRPRAALARRVRRSRAGALLPVFRDDLTHRVKKPPLGVNRADA